MMPFDYYCTNCGRVLSQSPGLHGGQHPVLFDMQYVITQKKEAQFNILKFRMTLAELTTIYQSGTQMDDNFRACKLSFSELARFISNENNLNDPEIAQLTRQDVEAYVGAGSLMSGVEEKLTKEDDSPFGTFGGGGGSVFDTIEPEETKVEAVPESTGPSAAILALENKDDTNKEITQAKVILQTELGFLRRAFEDRDEIIFRIRLTTEPDNQHKDVVTDYVIYPATYVANARVCNGCGYPVFPYAGTAKHQCVAFFGSQKSGKTSLLVALAHYAKYGLKIDFNQDIWRGAEQIEEVTALPDILNRVSAENDGTATAYRNNQFYADLADYEEGYAPKKTDARRGRDAYSVTMRLKDTNQQYHLLTLTDLPGELINEKTGEVDKSNLISNFPTALACEAYVICFDTQSGANAEQVSATLLAANTIQQMHAEKRGGNTHIPVIVVYTKNEELEAQTDLDDIRGSALISADMIKKSHMFFGECMAISQNRVYDFVFKQFNECQNLRDAYKTRLRCSAFGYTAPTREEVEKKSMLHVQKPTPKHVDALMRWILCVCGCIPVKGGYQAYRTAPVWEVPNNYATRLQFRSDTPQSEEEALLRCVLFENPGEIDIDTVHAHGNKAEKMFLKGLTILGLRKNNRD